MVSWCARFVAGAILVVAAAESGAQGPRRFDRLTGDSFESALKDIGTRYQREGNVFFLNVLPNAKTKIEIYEPLQAAVGFHTFPGITLTQVNDWNIKAVFSRAVHLGNDNPPGARLESDFDCDGGFDTRGVTRFLERYTKSLRDFSALPPGKQDTKGPPRKGPAPAFVTEVQTARVNFPLGASDQDAKTGWIVRYAADRRHGLRIVGAWFLRRGENPEWLKVIDDVHVNHLYVPYMEGSPRYFDMDQNVFPKHGPWRLDRAVKGDALTGPSGKIQADQYTVREDRDAGLLWLMIPNQYQMEKQIENERSGPTFGARRQEMTLWGVYQASNYFYIMQYSFQNDGTVVCKLGSTGANLAGHIGPGHMHNALWRVHLDISAVGPDQAGNFGQHTLAFVRHDETKQGNGAAKTNIVPVNTEAKFDWKAEEFNTLRLTNRAVQNRLGSPATYEVVPLRYGSARHYAQPQPGVRGVPHPGDDFMDADFWVTNHDHNRVDYRNLPAYVKAGAPLGANPVIWLSSSNLHLPRDEDFTGPAGARRPSSATVMFSGFEIRPRSILSETPYFDVPAAPLRPGQ